MKVIARKGLRVPMETGLRRYVTDATGVEVPNTVYYRRRVSDGDLIDDAAKIAKQEAEAKASADTTEKPATDTAASQVTGAASGLEPVVNGAGDKKTANGA